MKKHAKIEYIGVLQSSRALLALTTILAKTVPNPDYPSVIYLFKFHSLFFILHQNFNNLNN